MSGIRLRAPRRALAVAATAALLATSGVVVAAAATPPPAHVNNTAGLKQVGPIDETNGFPLWYKDTNGTRLELCLDVADPNCIMGDLPTPGQPMSFPDNFPDEAFWAMADASLATNGTGGKAILVTALEAAFASANGLPAAGQQSSFGRIRIRAAGVVDGATYKVTHPYGVDSVVAEAGAVKGLNVTEDIGDLVGGSDFTGALGSRPAPFLQWDAGAPAGYLGDPAVDHAVTGSPYGTNVFRIEGPLGSFPGSPDQCTNAGLGNSNSTTDLSDCIQTTLFSVMGKKATRAGVQVVRADYADATGGHTIDLFATSEPGQNLVISGTGISQTVMRSDADGNYFGRVFAAGAAPSDLAVTNTTDSPDTVDHVAASLFGDKVHITSSVYDNDDKSLTVIASSGDSSAALKLRGYPNVVPTQSGQAYTFKATNVPVPPADVTVTSSKTGSDSDDVVIIGSDFGSQQVVASISTDSNSVASGQPVTLDGTGSTGTISSFAWTVTGPSGATVATGSTPSITFTPATGGTFTAKLTVTGAGAGNSDTVNRTINVVAAAAATANAGPDQLNVVPTSTVTLDGSASTFATDYAWTQTGGPVVSLSKADTANPTFTVPAGSSVQTLVFSLKVTGVSGISTPDTVTVTTDPDTLSVDTATFKRGGNEWRIRGTAQYCSANNQITFTWNKPGAAPVVLGSTGGTLALGVCSFDYRLKDAATTARPTAGGTITVTSVLGGSIPLQAFQLL